MTVANEGPDPQDVAIYRAGDCYLQSSDWGYGRLENGTATCLAANPDGTKGDRIEEFAPITNPANTYHAGYWEVWSFIGTRQPFPNTCRCDEYIDNGAGNSWSRTIAAGASTTVAGSSRSRRPATSRSSSPRPATTTPSTPGGRRVTRSPSPTRTSATSR